MASACSQFIDRIRVALYRYFALVDTLPSPHGPLSCALTPATISDVNKAVMDSLKAAQRSKPRGKYSKLTPEQQAQIGKYASTIIDEN